MQKRSYLKFFKWLLLLFGALLFLVYGFAIGRYQVFPFDLLKSLKETDRERVLTAENLIHTKLQRLHINKVQVPEDLASGGAMTSSGRDVYVIDRHGNTFVLDLKSYEKSDVQIPQIYLGLDYLREDGWYERDLFDPAKVRVKGAYADSVEQNRVDLYVSHHLYENRCFVSLLSKIELERSGDNIVALGDWEEIYRTSPCMDPDSDFYDDDEYTVRRWKFGGHISGGRIIKYDDSHLLLSMGDHFYDGYDKAAYAQLDDNSYGKYILINKKTLEARNFAKGTRNAQGLYKDSEGTIWATEHGPDGGDELNVVFDGANYGWPEVTFGIQYHHNRWPGASEQGRHDRFVQPIFSWSNTIAPSDLIRIEGDKFDLWRGDLLVGTLSGRALHRLRPSDDKRHIFYDEKIELGHRIRNIILLHDSSILLRTDDNYLIHVDDAGPVYDSYNEDEFLEENEIARRFSEFSGQADMSDRVDAGAVAFAQSCGHCHTMSGGSVTGPRLNNLAGRPVGSADDYRYTQVLENSRDKWDEGLLKNYIRDPQSVYPGTSMGPVALPESELDLIVNYLLERDS